MPRRKKVVQATDESALETGSATAASQAVAHSAEAASAAPADAEGPAEPEPSAMMDVDQGAAARQRGEAEAAEAAGAAGAAEAAEDEEEEEDEEAEDSSDQDFQTGKRLRRTLARLSSGSKREPWICAACTFQNDMALGSCQMCNAPRGSSRRRAQAEVYVRRVQQEQEVSADQPGRPV